MWVFFNRDYGYNKRQDIVDIQDETFINDVLVKEKIAQVVSNPHATYESVKTKKVIQANIQATRDEKIKKAKAGKSK